MESIGSTLRQLCLDEKVAKQEPAEKMCVTNPRREPEKVGALVSTALGYANALGTALRVVHFELKAEIQAQIILYIEQRNAGLMPYRKSPGAAG